MTQTSIYKFDIPDDTVAAELDTIVASAVQSIEDNLPYRYAATIAALNAMTGTMYPNGMQATLTADDTGLKAGATFIRSGGKWLFNTGTTSSLSTFVAALTANIGTTQGASFYDIAGAVTRVFIDTAGGSQIVSGGSGWITIPYSTGYKNTLYGDVLGYLPVPGGVRLRGHIQRSNGKAIPAGTVIGNVPSAARPTNGQYFVASGVSAAIGNMLIQADGDIILGAPINRTSSWYSFDNVFLARG